MSVISVLCVGLMIPLLRLITHQTSLSKHRRQVVWSAFHSGNIKLEFSSNQSSLLVPIHCHPYSLDLGPLCPFTNVWHQLCADFSGTENERSANTASFTDSDLHTAQLVDPIASSPSSSGDKPKWHCTFASRVSTTIVWQQDPPVFIRIPTDKMIISGVGYTAMMKCVQQEFMLFAVKGGLDMTRGLHNTVISMNSENCTGRSSGWYF